MINTGDIGATSLYIQSVVDSLSLLHTQTTHTHTHTGEMVLRRICLETINAN